MEFLIRFPWLFPHAYPAPLGTRCLLLMPSGQESGGARVSAREQVARSNTISAPKAFARANQTPHFIFWQTGPLPPVRGRELAGAGCLQRGTQRIRLLLLPPQNSGGLTEDKRQVKAGGGENWRCLCLPDPSKTLREPWEAQRQEG